MKLRHLVASTFLFLLPFYAQAIVNVESMHLKEPPEGFSGQLALGADGKSGNSENFTASLGSQLQWRQGQITNLLNLSAEYGESFGEENANNSFFHLRRIHELSQTLAWEAFGQVEQDKFARLNYRGLVGGGVRFKLSKVIAKDRAIFLGLGVFYAKEELSDRGDLADSGTTTLVRGNFYLVLKKQLTNAVFASSTTYLQPNVEDERDFRALEDAQLGVKLSDKLTLSLKLQGKHDNRPPIAVEKTDISYSTGLLYQF